MNYSFSFRSLFIRWTVLSLAIAMGVSISQAQTVSDVDAIVQKAVDAKAVPGVGVAVVKDGKLVLAKGYGLADVETGAPAIGTTAFQIASVTKQFTAAGILLLVEDGKLKLDDALGKYLPEVPAKWSGITVRQLLNQVSGIPNYTAQGKLVNDKVYTHAEILDLVRDVPVDFEPGTKWAYSNTNYFLLGMVIEKVSGKSYPEYMSARIFKPLGMDSTVINTSGLKIKNIATGHEAATGKWQKSKVDDPSQPFAAGAIVSTPEDMAKWAAAVNDGKLLKKASWDEAFASGKLPDGKPTNYGFGWQIAKAGDSTFFAHSGGIAGFNSYHVRFPVENVSVVVLVNGMSRATQDLAMDIAGVYVPKVAALQAAQRASKNAAAIEDKDPELTKFLRGVFEGMVRGEGDSALFNAEMQKIMFPDNIKQLKGPLGSQGPIKIFELLTAENPDGGKRRIYRATFETGLKARVTFSLDAEGKISGANVRPE